MLTGFTLKTRYARLLLTPCLTACLHLLIIAVVGFIAYSNTFQVPFVLDDIGQIQKNELIRDLDNFLLALKGHNFGSGSCLYVPTRFVGYLSFALDYHFWGVDVKGYHITNLFIHITNALLVYSLVRLTFKTPHFRRRMLDVRRETSETRDRESKTDSRFTIHDPRSFIALFAALLFVSHPVQTQAVTYIVQRFASLATMFYLLSLVTYIKGRLSANSSQLSANEKQAVSRFTFHDSRFTIVWYTLSLLSAVLAMKTKEIAFTLPFVVILYEYVFLAAPLKKRLFLLLPVALTLIIVPLTIMYSDRPPGEILSDVSEKIRVQTQMSRGYYLLTEMRVITTYMRLIFIPVNQNLDYDYPIYNSLLDLPVLFSFLFLASLFGAAVYLLYKSRQGIGASGKRLEAGSEKKEGGEGASFPAHYSLFTIHCLRLIAFGILWFFITLSVESSIIPIVDVIFEHRVYLPSVGLFAAITTGIFLAAARLKKEKGLALILLLITLALSAATYARNNIWKDSAKLWEDVVKKSPAKARARNSLAEVFYKEGRLYEAIRELQTALVLDPDYVEAHNNLGMVYYMKGRMDKAMSEYRTALRLDPDHATAHNNLGAAYERLGRVDEAMSEYQAALRLDPDYATARNNLNALEEKVKRKKL